MYGLQDKPSLSSKLNYNGSQVKTGHFFDPWDIPQGKSVIRVTDSTLSPPHRGSLTAGPSVPRSLALPFLSISYRPHLSCFSQRQRPAPWRQSKRGTNAILPCGPGSGLKEAELCRQLRFVGLLRGAGA